jgi:hypothetical protein
MPRRSAGGRHAAGAIALAAGEDLGIAFGDIGARLLSAP